MTRYSVQPRNRIFVIKGYGFFTFAKNVGRNVGFLIEILTVCYRCT